MNRKQKAMEEKHLKAPRGNSQQRRKNAHSLELINKTRECTKLDVINELRSNKTAYLPKNSLLWGSFYGLFYQEYLEPYPWQVERDSIISAALEKAQENWDEKIAELQNIKWVDFLENYAIAEFEYRNSPLVRAMK
jgi:hypothetical protein